MIRILLVEDEQSIREPFAELLREYDYMVVTANNGLTAAQYLEIIPIDLVITDSDMPLCDAIELTRRIRRASAALPVIAISGEWQNEKPMMEAGANAFLLKPVEIEVLIGMIEELTKKGVAA
ncbi:response regulator [bacterium]|nr:response regulator [bacterium]MBU1636679.1 response regulator [bacterium]